MNIQTMELAPIVVSRTEIPMISISGEFERQKAELMLGIEGIDDVKNVTQASIVEKWLPEAARMLKTIDSCEEAEASVHWKRFKKVKDLGKLCKKGLSERYDALREKFGDYQLKIQQAAQAEARKIQEEAAKLEQKRQEALQDARAATTEDRRTELHQMAADIATAKRQVVATAVVVAAPPQKTDVNVAPEWKWKLIDAAALYKARPDLVDLVPSTARINAAVKGGVRECEGLEIFEGASVRVTKAI
jgi:hypothetical protein